MGVPQKYGEMISEWQFLVNKKIRANERQKTFEDILNASQDRYNVELLLFFSSEAPQSIQVISWDDLNNSPLNGLFLLPHLTFYSSQLLFSWKI